METPDLAEVCVRHETKRQVESLDRVPGVPEQWVCTAGEQCKMSLKPNQQVKELVDEVRAAASPQSTRTSLGGYSNPCSPTFAPPSSLQFSEPFLDECSPVLPTTSLSTSPLTLEEVVTSWAEEVNREYPLPQIEPSFSLSLEMDACVDPPAPCPELQQKSEEAMEEDPQTADLLSRLSRLEEELSETKRTLALVTANTARARQNGTALAALFRCMQADLNQIRPEGLVRYSPALTVDVSDAEITPLDESLGTSLCSGCSTPSTLTLDSPSTRFAPLHRLCRYRTASLPLGTEVLGGHPAFPWHANRRNTMSGPDGFDEASRVSGPTGSAPVMFSPWVPSAWPWGSL
eukprot:RCo042187